MPPNEPVVKVESQVQSGTSAPSDWRSQITIEEYKNNTDVKNAKSLDDYIKGAINASKMIGSRVAIPAEGDEKGWNEFYDKLGRPKTVNEYEFEKPDEKFLKENGLVYDNEAVESFKPLAHKLGLNKKQASELVKFYSDLNTTRSKFAREQADKQSAKEEAEALGKLKESWGKEYDGRKAQLDRFLQETMNETLANAVTKSGLGNHPSFIEWIYNMASDKMNKISPPGGHSTTTSADVLETKISELRKSPEFNKRLRGTYREKEAATEELNNLYKELYANK